MEFRSAPEVAEIASGLITTVPEHLELIDVRIEYVFRDRAAKSHGRTVLGTARKVTGLTAFLASADDPKGGPFFVLEIAQDTWERLTPEQRRALVDHKLCHCKVTTQLGGEPELSIKGHDLEEFAGVIRRHGLWKSDTAAFGSVVVEQLALAVDEVVTFVESIGTPEPEEPAADDGTVTEGPWESRADLDRLAEDDAAALNDGDDESEADPDPEG